MLDIQKRQCERDTKRKKVIKYVCVDVGEDVGVHVVDVHVVDVGVLSSTHTRRTKRGK